MNLRSKAKADQLKELGSQLSEDPEFEKELAAKQAYDKALQQCSAVKDASTIRPRLMQALAKQYQETYYGELAANDGKAVRPKSIRAWKDFAEAEIQAAVSKQKKLFEEISSTIPIADVKSYETKRFCSSAIFPRKSSTIGTCRISTRCTCNSAGYMGSTRTNILRGKAVIVAFGEASFQQLELAFYHDPKPGPQGIAHCDIKKNVVISCFAGNNPNIFPWSSFMRRHTASVGATSRPSRCPTGSMRGPPSGSPTAS